jgi:hypothetical protein
VIDVSRQASGGMFSVQREPGFDKDERGIMGGSVSHEVVAAAAQQLNKKERWLAN